MSTQVTTDYKMFKFRDDNRKRVNMAHVANLVKSIQSKNLLEFRPIIVNQDMEVIDGQHRLLAAESLGIPIYYQIKADIKDSDIILLNVANPWNFEDYLNYYVTHKNQDYVKLSEFMKKNRLSLKVCMSIFLNGKKDCYVDFKEGHFKFIEETHFEDVEICHQTIDMITKFLGPQRFTRTTKFWKALIVLIKHDSFSKEQWFKNVPRMISNFIQKPSLEEYLSGFLYIHNYKAHQKNRIEIDDKSVEF